MSKLEFEGQPNFKSLNGSATKLKDGSCDKGYETEATADSAESHLCHDHMEFGLISDFNDSQDMLWNDADSTKSRKSFKTRFDHDEKSHVSSVPTHVDDVQEATKKHNCEETRKKNNNVSFSHAEVRYYSIVLGDNPGGILNGPPISISWKHFDSSSVTIDEYEARKPSATKKCKELLITPFERKKMLRKIGCSDLDIKERIREVKAVKKQREKTLRKHLQHQSIIHIFNKFRLSPSNLSKKLCRVRDSL